MLDDWADDDFEDSALPMAALPQPASSSSAPTTNAVQKKPASAEEQKPANAWTDRGQGRPAARGGSGGRDNREGGFQHRDGGRDNREGGRDFQHRDGGRGRGGYDNRRGGRSGQRSPRDTEGGERRERERNPPPDSPPFIMFLGNLPYNTIESDLGEYFSDLNPKSVKIGREINTGRSKGFAYLEFHDKRSLELALLIDGQEYKGRQVNADVSIEKNRDFRGGKRDFGSGFKGTNNKPSGPPSLTLKPRSETPPAPVTDSPSKTKSEDPFGGASADDQKLQMRLKKEQEKDAQREQHKKEQLAKKEQEKQEKKAERDRLEKERKEKEAKEKEGGWSEKGKKTKDEKEKKPAGEKTNWRNKDAQQGQGRGQRKYWDDRANNADNANKDIEYRGGIGRGGKSPNKDGQQGQQGQGQKKVQGQDQQGQGKAPGGQGQGQGRGQVQGRGQGKGQQQGQGQAKQPKQQQQQPPKSEDDKKALPGARKAGVSYAAALAAAPPTANPFDVLSNQTN